MDKIYNPKEVEPRIMKFWDESKTFSFDSSSSKPVFSIDTPPPTISGTIHVGSVLGYASSEFIARYKRMKGFNVFYPMGFDDNGLASERYVEKKMGIKAVDMPRSEFVQVCLRETQNDEKEFRRIWEELGISVDWSLTYRTINELCQRVSQKSFIEIYKKGKAYRQEAPVTWCTCCQTAIAQAELEDAQRKTVLNTICFGLKDSDDKLKIATTRPEFLAACVGVFVNPSDKRYSELIGKTAIVPIFGYEVPIMADEKVDVEFGTGIVMVCTFGDKTDVEWWMKHKLPLKLIIDKQGRLNEIAGKYKGLRLEDSRKQILDELGSMGCLIEQKDIEQVVNVHERCSTPIEFFVSKQWYIRILDSKDKFLEMGDKIRWHPEHMRTRYRQWVEGLNADWCASRQRYFGVPFPVWYCKDCGAILIANEEDLPVDPLRDKPKTKCKCGSGEFEPDKDIMDTWATSSVTPLINCKWKEKDSYMGMLYPMSLRPQGYDIIRTWAFYTIAKNYFHENSIPWKEIMINGMGQDSKGKKMSKSKGNVVEPMPIKEKYSADALRYWVATARLGSDLPYQEKDVVTGQKTLTKLWNASLFCSNFIKKMEKPELKLMDRWLMSRLTLMVKQATESFEEYEYTDAKQAVDNFFWHTFCDNYLEIAKARAYAGDDSAKWTLYQSLLTMLKLFSPIIPFVTEEIYQNLFRGGEKDNSIHNSKWPEFDESLFDDDAQKVGEVAVAIISAVRQFKSKRGLALNTPVKKLVIECSDKEMAPSSAIEKSMIERVAEDIKGTMKVESLEFGSGEVPVEGYQIKLAIAL
jgi:valyl-tRNA synthetase